ncbi:MAG: DUF58 domain-containing protein [Acidimicrobiia bacterium]
MSARGYGTLITAILCGFGSVLFGSKFFMIVSAVCFILICVSYVWIKFHKKHAQITRALSPEFVYEQSDVLATLTIRGTTIQCSIQDYFDNGKKTTKFFLPKTTKSTVSKAQYKFHVERRGLYSIGPLIVKATDPLGLCVNEYVIPHETQLRVYPQIKDVLLPRIPLRSSEQSQHMDRNASTMSDDLLGLKEYVMGDDVRLIHWKTSSRTQGLFVRHRERQATLPLVIILDCEDRSYEDEIEFDAAARLIASISYAAQSQDIPCRLFCNDNGEFSLTHSSIMDRLSVTETSAHVQSPADSNRALAQFEHNYMFVTGSHGELFSSAILTLRITSDEKIQPETFNMIPIRKSYECSDFTTRIKQWNAHASLQSLS